MLINRCDEIKPSAKYSILQVSRHEELGEVELEDTPAWLDSRQGDSCHPELVLGP